MTTLSVTLSDIHDAAVRICRPEYVQETPLIDAPVLAAMAGFASLSVKNETVHPVGVFKLRGAYNHFLQMTGEQKKRGVIALSSGNHAQGVAYVAREFQVAATILMPENAPRIKKENTRKYGAEVITYDPATQDREELAQRIAEERGLHFIHPYNDPRTIAGQGTIGIEIHRHMIEKGITPDAIVIPCSGGGLAAGVALTRGLYAAPPAIFTAEPKECDDTRRSLESGERLSNPRKASSVCDALLAISPGSNTLPILRQHGARGLTVTDEDVAAAMYLAPAYEGPSFSMRLEPSGAIALACALRHREQFAGKNVVVIASGANVDPETYADMIKRGQQAATRLLAAKPLFSYLDL